MKDQEIIDNNWQKFKGKLGLVKVEISLVLPSDVVAKGKDAVAIYLNNKLENDPEFFGDFGNENIVIVTDDIETLG